VDAELAWAGSSGFSGADVVAWTWAKIAGSTGWDTAGAELVQLDGTQLSGGGQAELTPKACSQESKIKCSNAISLER